MSRPDRISVLVVDDHYACRVGTAGAIEDDERLELLGTAADGREAVEKIRGLSPDAVALDVSMPVMDGAEVLSIVRREGIDVRVLLLTGYARPGPVHDALLADPDGFLEKESSYEEVCEAIVSMVRDEREFPAKSRAATAAAVAHARPRLSEQQHAALELAAGGLRMEQIAKELSVSVTSAKASLRAAREKLDTSTTTQAVATAFRVGLFD